MAIASVEVHRSARKHGVAHEAVRRLADEAEAGYCRRGGRRGRSGPEAAQRDLSVGSA